MLKKIVIFSIIILACVGTIINKNSFGIDDNIQVVSKSETKSKETVKDTSININEEKSNDNSININKNNISSKEITIYISGEVNNPGIVTLDKDERLSFAIEKIGGLTKDADLNAINLAIRLEDEKHYIIPKIGEKVEALNEIAETNTQSEKVSNDSKKTDKININIASIQELDSLPGVGEATANKIVKYREDNGNFRTIEELKNVNGIGEKKYEDLKDLISTD
ncbi:MAG: helix-hairpin-helix domain-containing protein [Romboutsia sp.]